MQTPVKLVVFDAYGTLFDVYSVRALAETMYPGHGEAIANLWRDKQVEYTRLATMSDPDGARGSRYFQSFWDITRLSLRYTLQRLRLAEHTTYEEGLMQQYLRLAPHAESLDVLRTLQQDGMPCAILSNGSVDMLQAVVDNAGFAPYLDRLLSVDPLRLFKTAPQTYGLVEQVYALARTEVLFVSSNAWDALGATWFGFQTLWVNRVGLPAETLGPSPTFTGGDLREVLNVLEGGGA